MNQTIRLGRVAGIEIGANWTWIAVFLLIASSLALNIFPERDPGLPTSAHWAMGIAASLLFFGSILLHELGHAVQARRDGVRIDGITLWLFGGVAKFRDMYGSPGAEFRIAIAGPAVTVMIAAGLLAVGATGLLPAPAESVVVWLAYINIVLLVFNMLPALPLDGGRVLHAALWRLKGDLMAATRIGAAIGVGFGFLLIAGGLALVFTTPGIGGLWLALIGWFLTIAARAEAVQTAARRALRGTTVRDVMTSDPMVLSPDMTLRRFVDEFGGRTQHRTYPVVEGGRPVGLLDFEAVADVSHDERERLRVGDRMSPAEKVSVLHPEQPAEEAMQELSLESSGRAMVVDDGALVGIISPADLQHALQVRGADEAGVPADATPSGR